MINSKKIIVAFFLNCIFTIQLYADNHLHSLNFQDADIRLLIETVSDMTGKNFVIDPQVQGKVTVISGHPVSKEEVYDIFLSVLSVHGLAAVKEGKSIKIVSEAEAGGIMADFSIAEDSDFVTRIIRLNYVSSDEIATMLKNIKQKLQR